MKIAVALQYVASNIVIFVGEVVVVIEVFVLNRLIIISATVMAMLLQYKYFSVQSKCVNPNHF